MGNATILHLNTRKEGPEDAQELAVDLKLKATADVMITRYFDEQLATFVFLSNGAVRNKVMGPITFAHELESYRLDMVGSTFTGVRVKKFALEPKDGFKVGVTFAVSFQAQRRRGGARRRVPAGRDRPVPDAERQRTGLRRRQRGSQSRQHLRRRRRRAASGGA
ncbi:hypothetical protein [Cupriavidus sp. USMAA2-4]|uniref:hypothetical protein n=1 Tax=Cupriavidus sp. USMAA2-4 TaxID=876364 RepID=UPI001E315144|nr:hypothetical protein [Cupriavidus sp. USMAA2-4]